MHLPAFMEPSDNLPEQLAPLMTHDPNFDILDWHPAYQSCQKYFLDYAQHEPATQALCALINIKLPFQWLNTPVYSSTPPQSSASNNQFNFGGYPIRPNGVNSPHRSRHSQPLTFVSLVPYIRRLVVTAFDKPPILHGLFGDDYPRGVLPHIDCERRNYLFAAKHGGWRTCKKQYDEGSGGGGVGAGDETVPFMKPLDQAKIEELNAAEKAWSSWLAMEDWMVGPRAPEEAREGGAQQPFGQTGGYENGRGGNSLPDGLPDGGGHRAYRSH
ncbi:hypothetical protein LTR62_000565 [Meristemomyces frigidus]|uniref:Uncharacterized protein n=1 Tax=Meristemomyces frigidus TaxID=1508187 RepID=A0AAN7TCY5_9PEZI|nr:hypothetical protein LTR62_000565 [Meristemomyces frigidus]